MNKSSNAGWLVGESIPLELDMALTSASGYLNPEQMTAAVLALVAQLPDDWRHQWPALLGEPRSLGVLDLIARWANVLLTPDYSAATLAMRETTLDEALARTIARARPFGLVPESSRPPAEQLARLEADLTLALYRMVGLQRLNERVLSQRVRHEAAHAVRLLREGDLHARFWHWLDRFFYEVYAPWRATQGGVLEALTRRAVTELGALEQTGQPPPLDWLSPKHPLRISDDLAAPVRAGALRVFFWVEPFGLFDASIVEPGWIGVSFAEPGELYETFVDFVDDLAIRLKALSDPTRLTILRLVRNFSMDNTTMAAYLDLARPTVSVHAKVLREAGLIRTHHAGRQAQHEIVSEAVWQLLRDLQRFLDLPTPPDDAPPGNV